MSFQATTTSNNLTSSKVPCLQRTRSIYFPSNQSDALLIGMSQQKAKIYSYNNTDSKTNPYTELQQESLFIVDDIVIEKEYDDNNTPQQQKNRFMNCSCSVKLDFDDYDYDYNKDYTTPPSVNPVLKRELGFYFYNGCIETPCKKNE
jgi:hypothetical protein